MSRRMRFLFVAFLIFMIPPSGTQAKSASKRATGSPSSAPGEPHSLLDVQLFQVDAAHSNVEFAVPWMGLTKVKGTFTDVRGSIGFDENDLTRSSITVVIKTPSITTWNPQRDKDLKGANFFDVQTFPTAMFASRSLEKTADGYLMHGSLTIKGITKGVNVPFAYLGHVVDSGGVGHRLGFEGRFTIDRRDYGVLGTDEFNKLTQLGQRTIGDKVDLLLSIQGWMFTPARLPQPADSLYQAIVRMGMANVERHYREVRAKTPDSLMVVDEDVINTVGYHLLRQDRARDALQLFMLEAESYPESPFAQVGLGQAYAAMGNRELAIASCEKAVAMNPGATRALEMLRRLKTSG